METAIGVFNSRDRAEKALKELLHRDVPKESIVFLTTSETEAASLAIEFGALAGGVAGSAAGVTGALVVTTLLLIPGFGQALALGIGATALLGLAGAGVGSAVAKSAATDRTVPQPMPDNQDAALFRQVLKDGRSLIIVKTNYHDVASAACSILDRMGLGIQDRTNLKTTAATREADGVSVVDIRGKITLGEGNIILRDIIRSLVREGKTKVVLNLSAVEFIDSAGIGELVGSHSSLHRAGGQLKIASPTKKVQDMLKMTSLNSVFDIHADEASAIKSFGHSAGAKA
ncbi:MAG: STAS domain-containing protein [Candidatus Acidiferrales bacterium]|jgi:anti-sigma B factor antagonist